MRDGWNLPGDSVRIDEDGYVFYQARADDMIVSAGYNISGPEVESVLMQHEAVAECGVIGVRRRNTRTDRQGVCRAQSRVMWRTMHSSRNLQDFVKQQRGAV